MPMGTCVDTLAVSVVALAGVFLVLLGFASLVAPAKTGAFLLGFAATPARHCLELVVRLIVGLSFLVAAMRFPWSQAFFLAGALLVGTTVVMGLLPFRLHRAFAAWAVPKALARLTAIGLVSFAGGAIVLWSAWVASAGLPFFNGIRPEPSACLILGAGGMQPSQAAEPVVGTARASGSAETLPHVRQAHSARGSP